LVAIGLFYYGFNFLKGSDLFDNSRIYYAEYSRIDGLSSDNNVQYNGYNIGKVKSIYLNPVGARTIVVEFVITEEKLEIPINTTAEIISQDLLGSKVLSLKLGNATEMAQDGDTLKSALEEDLKSAVDRRLKPLERKVSSVVEQIDSVVTSLKDILDKDGRENLSQSFESIKNSFVTFERTSLRIDTLVANEKLRVEQILVNVASITQNFKNNNDQLTHVIQNLESISDSLAKADLVTAVDNASHAMKDIAEVMHKINEGEGSMGQLVNNDTLYMNLEQSALELDKLLEDMRVNPQRYIHFSLLGRKESTKNKPQKKPR